ncbi:hypothetical protein O3M35_005285 [Rhynocoris fuscipes]|uniref:Uncharacterized protein n=1 Tax=Rhynocoris fuscipes TaxID=488301 RepID=A0AAW1DKD8_9HEMI
MSGVRVFEYLVLTTVYNSLLLISNLFVISAEFNIPGLDCQFEGSCHWKWNSSTTPSFRVVTGQEVNNSWVPGDGALGGPFSDADNNTHVFTNKCYQEKQQSFDKRFSLNLNNKYFAKY